MTLRKKKKKKYTTLGSGPSQNMQVTGSNNPTEKAAMVHIPKQDGETVVSILPSNGNSSLMESVFESRGFL